MLERLVLKSGVECTSQRLKRMSGARVMTIFCRLVRLGGSDTLPVPVHPLIVTPPLFRP